MTAATDDGFLLVAIKTSQARATRIMIWVTLVGAAIVLTIGFFGVADLVFAAIGCAAVCALSAAGLWTEGAVSRLCAGLGMIGLPLVFTATLANNPAQNDSYTFAFAALAALITLNDTRVMIAGAVLAAMQQVVFSGLFPTLVFYDVTYLEGIVRGLVNSVLIVAGTAALVSAVKSRQRLDQLSQDQFVQVEALLAAAEERQIELQTLVTIADAAIEEGGKALADAQEHQRNYERETEARIEMQDNALFQAESEAVEREMMADRTRATVNLLREAVKQIGDGNLDCTITQSFELEYEDLRNDFNNMLGELRQSLRQAINHIGTIDSETGSISAAAQSLAKRSESQSVTMDQTVSSIEEISAAANSAADRANAARKKSQAASENAEKGNEIVAAARVTMQEISASSERIFKITSVIDEISFQTNLLALNAGVEAARVGAEGRGFAVVASEVRALAQRSSDAAKDINDLIVESGALIKQGVKRVEEAGQALTSIVEQVRQITADVTEIASFVNDQSKGIGEVSVSMQDLGHISQQIAAMFEETSAATTALESETEELRDLLGRFEIGPEQSQNARAA